MNFSFRDYHIPENRKKRFDNNMFRVLIQILIFRGKKFETLQMKSFGLKLMIIHSTTAPLVFCDYNYQPEGLLKSV